MAKDVLTPLVLLTHKFASPDLCAWEQDGADTLWLQGAVCTSGLPAMGTGHGKPQERSRDHYPCHVSVSEDGTPQLRRPFNMSGQALPSDFGVQPQSSDAKTAATWFMGCSSVDDPNWPAVWDLAPHLLTTIPYGYGSGLPLACTWEAWASPVPQARALAAAAGRNDYIQPWFVIGWERMSQHQRLIAVSGFEASIRLHAAANLWDSVFDISDPVLVS